MQKKRNFTGQILDGTGLMFYNARYYDPRLGRFLSADTVVPGSASGSMDGVAVTPLTVDFHEGGFRGSLNAESAGQRNAYAMGPLNPQSLNRYSYVLNNPMRYTDPTGHYRRWNHDEAKEALNLLNDFRKKLHEAYYNRDADRNVSAEIMQTIGAIIQELTGTAGAALEAFLENIMHVLSDETLYEQFDRALDLLMWDINNYVQSSSSGDGSYIEVWMDAVQDLGGSSYTHYIYSQVTNADGTTKRNLPIYAFKNVWHEETALGNALYGLLGGPKPPGSGNGCGAGCR